MPPLDSGPALPSDHIVVVLAAMLDEQISSHDLDYGRPFPRPGLPRQNEIVVSWASF
ncbi:MAG: hypothetical protein ACK5PP_02120 [Acidimicrobiales bacterium]